MALPTTQPHQLVVLEEGTLFSMANNPEIVQEFPFLAAIKNAPVVRRGCSSCGRRASVGTDVVMSVKRQIAALDSSRKQILKRLLNTRSLRVIYRRGDKKVINLTF